MAQVTDADADRAKKSVEPSPEPDQDSDEVADRLIRKAITGSDEQLLDTALRLMDESARSLEIDFDPGLHTLARQERIVMLLDEATRRAAMQRQRQSGSGADTPSDTRSMPQSKRPSLPSKADETGDTASQSGDETGSTGTLSTTEDSKEGGKLRDLRRSWGHLPPRARDELIQGFDEAFVERYREWIERYYRALQETNE